MEQSTNRNGEVEEWDSRHHDKSRKLGEKLEERFVDVSDTNGLAGPLDKWKRHGI